MIKQIAWLLFAFAGRANRSQFWLGFVVLLAASVAGTLAVDPDYFNRDGATPRMVGLLANGSLAFICGMALTIKRLNDRDWPSWVGPLYGVISLPLAVGEQVGLLPPEVWDQLFSGVWSPAILYLHFAMLLSLSVFVDNGFFRGTPGPNRHGPDPVETGTPRAARSDGGST